MLSGASSQWLSLPGLPTTGAGDVLAAAPVIAGHKPRSDHSLAKAFIVALDTSRDQ